MDTSYQIRIPKPLTKSKFVYKSYFIDFFLDKKRGNALSRKVFFCEWTFVGMEMTNHQLPRISNVQKIKTKTSKSAKYTYTPEKKTY